MARGSKQENTRDSGSAGAGNRTPDALVRDIEEARDRLALTIDRIVERVHPKNAAKRTLGRVRSRFVNDDGSPRLENIAPVAGGIVGVAALVVVVRHLVGRD
ncbi:MAG TPA: DUF3618 domain-containing protein [Nocardioidaceae bacterium]|nr:DUF3618 domain-containing protein [Nocardioidaceae bacterium]